MRWIPVLIALVACGSPRRGVPMGDPVALGPRAEHGERVFQQHCHQCHPFGEGGLAPAINNKRLPGWAIELQVREGLGAMPAFHEEELAEPDLDAIVDYLTTLRKASSDASR